LVSVTSCMIEMSPITNMSVRYRDRSTQRDFNETAMSLRYHPAGPLALRAPCFEHLAILTMSRAFQIVTYMITWSSFLVAIASCILRIHCCRCIKLSWKADDFMSLVVGVSARFEPISKTRRLICRAGVPRWSAGPLATSVPDGLRRVSDDIGTTTMVLTRQQTRAKRLQLHQAKWRCSDGSFPRDPRDSS
jgi:hypothetical protein